MVTPTQWFGVVTLFPEMVADAAGYGVFRRAQEAGLVSVEAFNPRDFTTDKHRTVDDKPYGGGAGMVMMAEPLLAAIEAARAAGLEASGHDPEVLLMSAQGARFEQRSAERLAQTRRGLVLVCGRYEGVDERVIEQAIDREVSLGDYVLSGGELAALVIMDAVSRLQEGGLGNPDSLLSESHLDGSLEYPQYTRPEIVQGLRVPAELLSGDHQKVAEFRRRQALERTYDRRPQLLLKGSALEGETDRELLLAALKERPER